MSRPSIDFFDETFTTPAPPEEAFTLLADIERWPTWSKGVTWAKAPKDLRAGIWFAFLYRIDRKRHAEILEQLEVRRAERG